MLPQEEAVGAFLLGSASPDKVKITPDTDASWQRFAMPFRAEHRSVAEFPKTHVKSS
jgi:hypothetical protein